MHSINAIAENEQAFVASLMGASPKQIVKLSEFVLPTDLFSPQYQQLYSLILNVSQQGATPEPVVLANEYYKQTRGVNALSAKQTIGAIYTSGHLPQNILFYAMTVLEHAAIRAYANFGCLRELSLNGVLPDLKSQLRQLQGELVAIETRSELLKNANLKFGGDYGND